MNNRIPLHRLERLLDSLEPQKTTPAEISLLAAGVILVVCVIGLLVIVVVCWVW